MGGQVNPDPFPEHGSSTVRVPLPGPDFDPVDAAKVGDFDDGHFEWLMREMGAGRLQPPPEYAIDSPAVSVSFSDTWDVDPDLLAAICGQDELDGHCAGTGFGQGESADTLRPAPRPVPPSAATRCRCLL